MAIPIKSQDGTTSSNEYDPWIDTNDDGIIDIFDIAELALAFGAEGEPINKTALLLEILDRLNSLEATAFQQQIAIDNLASAVAYLNDTLIELNGTQGLGPPDYDSGWMDITQKIGQNITAMHNLSSTNVMVDITGRTTLAGGIHQKQIGGEDYTVQPNWEAIWGGIGNDEAWSVVQTRWRLRVHRVHRILWCWRSRFLFGEDRRIWRCGVEQDIWRNGQRSVMVCHSD